MLFTHSRFLGKEVSGVFDSPLHIILKCDVDIRKLVFRHCRDISWNVLFQGVVEHMTKKLIILTPLIRDFIRDTELISTTEFDKEKKATFFQTETSSPSSERFCYAKVFSSLVSLILHDTSLQCFMKDEPQGIVLHRLVVTRHSHDQGLSGNVRRRNRRIWLYPHRDPAIWIEGLVYDELCPVHSSRSMTSIIWRSGSKVYYQYVSDQIEKYSIHMLQIWSGSMTSICPTDFITSFPIRHWLVHLALWYGRSVRVLLALAEACDQRNTSSCTKRVVCFCYVRALLQQVCTAMIFSFDVLKTYDFQFIVFFCVLGPIRTDFFHRSVTRKRTTTFE